MTYIKALEPFIVKLDEIAVEEASCFTPEEPESSLEPAGESCSSISTGLFLLLDLLVVGSLDFFLLWERNKQRPSL